MECHSTNTGFNYFEPQIDWFLVDNTLFPFYMGNVIAEDIDIEGVIYLN